MKKISTYAFLYLICQLYALAQTSSVKVPVITSFTPTSGPVGTSVTLKGSGFDTIALNNVVYFGATKAEVVTAKDTFLVVKIPSGASYRPISVLNKKSGRAGESSRPFLVTFPNGKLDSSTFASNIDFKTGFAPYFVNMGDLDGDGKIDLVVVNFNSNTISIFRNTSHTGSIDSTSFAKKVDFVTGNNPWAVYIEDVDNDGKVDVVVSNQFSNTVSIFRNTTHSGSIDSTSFAPKVDLPAGNQPSALAMGDIDGDGRKDIAVTNYLGNSISVIRNITSSGKIDSLSFAPKVDFPTGTQPVSMSIGDIDGDNKLDLAVVNFGSKTMSILRNTTVPNAITLTSFAAKVDFNTLDSPIYIRLGDLNGDAKLDPTVTTLYGQAVSVFRNLSSPGSIISTSLAVPLNLFTKASFFPYATEIGDLDGDGKPDLAITSNGLSLLAFKNTSPSTTNPPPSFSSEVDFDAGTLSQAISLGDLDGDGKTDAVVANPVDNTISVFRNYPGQKVLSGIELNELKPGTLLAYPNPTYTSLNIQFNGGYDLIMAAEVYSSDGLLLFTKQGSMDTFMDLNLAHLPQGIYVIKVTGQKSVVLKKVTKL